MQVAGTTTPAAACPEMIVTPDLNALLPIGEIKNDFKACPLGPHRFSR
jgi:hypothetical protein